ncbi:X-ray radiation resistance-associated protein 1 [Cyprinus carpio]|uniref:X-ray radiation resistance-associated protein 1 n=1 Tax=Cyprinus carpio TaxID=7962 RepID=A0A9Q9VLT5_CYPCA|nr:X-ray radiation resistance-associated protein 1 [Cyprinus carpio]
MSWSNCKRAGHWLVANRNTLEERTSKRKNISGSHFELHSGKHEKRQPESASNCLDAQLFLTLCCVDKPSDLCSVNISGQRLQTCIFLILIYCAFRLRHLNLQGNYISGVPFLEKVETLQDAQTGIMPQSIGQNVNTVNDERIKFSEITMSQQKPEKTVKEDKACLEMHSGPLQYYHQRKEDGCAQGLPFPELCHLNLANNEIAEEEALLPVALFPKLSELVIHSNPLTTQRSGKLTLLSFFVIGKLGIKITRKKTTDLIKRHEYLLNERCVKTTLSKFPSITANQHSTETLFSKKCTGPDNPLPLEYGLTHVFGFSSQTSIDDEEDIDIGQEHFDLTSADIFFETNQNAEPFFVTEVILLHLETRKDPDVSKETELEKGCKACPEKLIGYEILLDDTPELEMPEFSGIQQAVSVLEHMLKNLLVYRDSKANLDLPQKPYTEREKKIKNLPPLGPKKSKGKKVEELLYQIKEAKTIKVPLDSVLEGGNGICKREYEEALMLLKDMKRKYRTAYLKRVEQAAQIENEMMCNLN